MKKTEAVVKTESASNWAKAVNYIPAAGTIIVYEFDDTMPRVKIGDGQTLVNQLPFLVNPPPEVRNDTLDLSGGF